MREEKPIKYETTNKSQPEHAQVDNPNPKSKTKWELVYFQNINKCTI